MEEYEIRDVSRRGEVPDLRIEFALPKTELKNIPGTAEFEPLSLNAVVINDAIEPANYAIIKLYIDARLDIISAQGYKVSVVRNSSTTIGDKQVPVTTLQVYWSIPERLPIFHEEMGIIDALLFKTTVDGRMGKPKYYLIGYEIKSPRMPVKSSFSILEVRSGFIWLSQTQLTEQEVLANYHKLSQ